jgi:hypothetical protein
LIVPSGIRSFARILFRIAFESQAPLFLRTTVSIHVFIPR